MQAFDYLPTTDVVRKQDVVCAESHKALILAYYLGCCFLVHHMSILSFILLFLLSLESLSIMRWYFFATNGHRIRSALSRYHSNNSIFFSISTSIMFYCLSLIWINPLFSHSRNSSMSSSFISHGVSWFTLMYDDMPNFLHIS